ncbi:hypothetical protein, partial [Duganella lactea]|uniref:hypothetical protein n=1 Tax=Duganella lactea TaxID=2692173 RepID=UPI001E351394
QLRQLGFALLRSKKVGFHHGRVVKVDALTSCHGRAGFSRPPTATLRILNYSDRTNYIQKLILILSLNFYMKYKLKVEIIFHIIADLPD